MVLTVPTAQIEKMKKNTKYIHCPAPNLSLILNYTVNEVSQDGSFFDILYCLPQFFYVIVKN